MNTDPFWVVWNPATGQPKARHWTKLEAKEEASRLALANSGHTFFVLESVCSFSCRNLEEIDLRPKPVSTF